MAKKFTLPKCLLCDFKALSVTISSHLTSSAEATQMDRKIMESQSGLGWKGPLRSSLPWAGALPLSKAAPEPRAGKTYLQPLLQKSCTTIRSIGEFIREAPVTDKEYKGLQNTQQWGQGPSAPSPSFHTTPKPGPESFPSSSSISHLSWWKKEVPVCRD